MRGLPCGSFQLVRRRHPRCLPSRATPLLTRRPLSRLRPLRGSPLLVLSSRPRLRSATGFSSPSAEETHATLRRLQALLRREIPDGDPGKIFDRAATLLLEKVEKAKLGATSKPRPRKAIRPETDNRAGERVPSSRHIPSEVRRAVWRRDGNQCAFVSAKGHRCTERTFLELHHVQAYAHQGPATVENISLRCRRHNQYEAELLFGPHGPSTVGEAARTSP